MLDTMEQMNDIQTADTSSDDKVAPERRSGMLGDVRRVQAQWHHTPLSQRLRIIARLPSLIARHADELCDTVVRTAAQPGEVLASELLPLAEASRYVAKRGKQALQPRRLSNRDGAWWMGSIGILETRQPWGVVLVIGPSNYPLLLPGVQVIQALAAGNGVLIKPAPHGDAVMDKLADLCSMAGVPRGLIRVLETTPEAAQSAIELGVDKVLFTGSLSTGRKVAQQLVPTMTPAAMELSGNDPVLVLDDADHQRVASAVAYALQLNGGQTCIGPRRLFATKKTLAQLLPLLRAELHNAFPRAIASAGLATAQAAIDQALEQGAEVACGSMQSWGQAGQVTPLVLSKVSPAMAVAQEDIFAPVLSLIEVGNMDSAVDLASSSPYALGASVFGEPRPARDFAEKMVAGCVCINDVLVPTADPRVSFGGWRASGYGVTRGLEGLRQMSQLKVTCERRGRWLPHLSTPADQLSSMLRGILLFRHGGTLAERWTGLKGLVRAVRQATVKRNVRDKPSEVEVS